MYKKGTREMNKPIAWTTDELNTDNWGDTDWQITVTKEKWSDKQKPLYIHPADITDEEITIVKEAVGHYVCTIKMAIDQEKQTFKGYENCSNLTALRSELKDAEQALAILRKAQEK